MDFSQMGNGGSAVRRSGPFKSIYLSLIILCFFIITYKELFVNQFLRKFYRLPFAFLKDHRIPTWPFGEILLHCRSDF